MDKPALKDLDHVIPRSDICSVSSSYMTSSIHSYLRFAIAIHRSSIHQSIDKGAPRANSAPPLPTSEVRTPCTGAIVPDGESLPEHTAAGAPGGKGLDGPAAGGAVIKAGLAAAGGRTQLRVYDDRFDSTPGTDHRRNEFHTLRDAMHQKRAVGMRWGVRRECYSRPTEI